jgi:membrane protein DedA with SNARE-associated domain
MDPHTISQWLAGHGAVLIFFLLMLGIVGLPIPDETVLTVAGYMVSAGKLTAWSVVLAALGGALCGITVSYCLGRAMGNFLLKHSTRWLRIGPNRLIRMHDWYERWGRWALVVGYFIPGVRHLVALFAGTARMAPTHFATFAYAGALIWVTTFLVLGYGFGEEWSHLSARVHHLVGAISVVIVLVLVVFMVVRSRKKSPPAS